LIKENPTAKIAILTENALWTLSDDHIKLNTNEHDEALARSLIDKCQAVISDDRMASKNALSQNYFLYLKNIHGNNLIEYVEDFLKKNSINLIWAFNLDLYKFGLDLAGLSSG
jgi:hypothetical protein